MSGQINVMKLKCMDQRFGLGYKPRKNDYKRAAQIRRKTKMARIEGKEPKEEELVISLLSASFPRSAKVIIAGITNLHISNLECQKKGQIEEADVGINDEVLL